MEQHEQIERRTFGSGGALDGYAGFRTGQSYQLRYTVLDNGYVSIEMDHAREGVEPLVIPATNFYAWFQK
jgi:hypothetical protein